MVGYKKKNAYKKKRKGFTGISRWDKPKMEEHLAMAQSHPANVTSTFEDDDTPRPSASRKKLNERGYRDEADTTNEDDFSLIGPGYRLIDLDNLASTVIDLHQCEEGMCL